jgi:hypothetical protein
MDSGFMLDCSGKQSPVTTNQKPSLFLLIYSLQSGLCAVGIVVGELCVRVDLWAGTAAKVPICAIRFLCSPSLRLSPPLSALFMFHLPSLTVQ